MASLSTFLTSSFLELFYPSGRLVGWKCIE